MSKEKSAPTPGNQVFATGMKPDDPPQKIIKVNMGTPPPVPTAAPPKKSDGAPAYNAPKSKRPHKFYLVGGDTIRRLDADGEKVMKQSVAGSNYKEISEEEALKILKDKKAKPCISEKEK